VSSISASFKRVEAMPYTPYVEDCITALEIRKESSTDACLAKLVRTQVVIRKLAQALPADDFEHQWSFATPVGMIVKALEGELGQLLTADMDANSTPLNLLGMDYGLRDN
jgi:hypothetical protein